MVEYRTDREPNLILAAQRPLGTPNTAWILTRSYSVASRSSRRLRLRSSASSGLRQTMRRSSGYSGELTSARSPASRRSLTNSERRRRISATQTTNLGSGVGISSGAPAIFFKHKRFRWSSRNCPRLKLPFGFQSGKFSVSSALAAVRCASIASLVNFTWMKRSSPVAARE